MAELTEFLGGRPRTLVRIIMITGTNGCAAVRRSSQCLSLVTRSEKLCTAPFVAQSPMLSGRFAAEYAAALQTMRATQGASIEAMQDPASVRTFSVSRAVHEIPC